MTNKLLMVVVVVLSIVLVLELNVNKKDVKLDSKNKTIDVKNSETG